MVVWIISKMTLGTFLLENKNLIKLPMSKTTPPTSPSIRKVKSKCGWFNVSLNTGYLNILLKKPCFSFLTSYLKL